MHEVSVMSSIIEQVLKELDKHNLKMFAVYVGQSIDQAAPSQRLRWPMPPPSATPANPVCETEPVMQMRLWRAVS